jgi:carbamoyltransferase
LFVQPVANDAGLAIGAGYLDQNPNNVQKPLNIYLGPSFSTSEIKTCLQKNKISYSELDNVATYVANRIVDGDIVGWFQGAMEMGPRALGNRSILADPRSEESRERVNKYVKHREEWRPFAPSILADAADDFLVNCEPSPHMIKTFDVVAENQSQIEAVLHPGDQTTRPQTVTKEQNPRYYKLISEFESLTGVPAVLNTSFNDHGEPIVLSPKEAIKDFYGMGLDILVLEDLVVEK